MKLITKQMEKQLPLLYSTEGIDTQDKQIFCKFFTPDSNWTWYVVEGERSDNGDLVLFGLVDGLEKEWGYFTLSELESVRGMFGLPVERDLYFGSPTIKEAGV